MRVFRTLPGILLGLSVGLTGCYKTVRVVQKIQAPEVFRTAPVEVLEQQLSERDAAIKTLNASVLVTASTGGGKEGKETKYTSLKGYIFVRKPSDLRVILQLPVLGSRAVDMVSDGKEFKLLINTLTSSRALIGTNEVTKPSKNGLENLRPAVFFDSLLVPGKGPDEYVTLTESTRLLPNNERKHTVTEEPDYDLTISKLKSDHVLQRLRVVHINRVDMLPFQQDIYDPGGKVVTQATYENYKDFGSQKFPTTITIQRPQDEYTLKLGITKLMLNETLEDDQFELKIPAGVAVQKME